jgi:hypothetical protein
MLRLLSRTLLGIGLITAAAFALQGQPAHAIGATVKHPARAAVKHGPQVPSPNAKHYFVEWRGRNAASYGHLYVMYGEVNDRDEIIRSKIAGLYPAGDHQDCENCSLANWMIGHVVFVPSGTTATDGDLEEKYVTARYRVMLDKAQYDKLTAYITKFQADPPQWHAILRNCVSFGRDIANLLDMKVPPFPILTPEQFVTQLREMNGTPEEQAPLKDAATMQDAPATAVAQHKAIRHAKQPKRPAQTASASVPASSH